MKKNIVNSIGILKLIVAAGLTIASVSLAAGPTNSWNEWPFKKVLFAFSNAPICSLNGHVLPQFATNLLDSQTKIYLYAESDGKVFGVGNTSLQFGNRQALFNLKADGSLSTVDSQPNLAFTLHGKGPGVVGDRSGAARLTAKFVQTEFLTFGSDPLEQHYAEGRISGAIEQPGVPPLYFEDTIRVPLDHVAGLGRAYAIFDMTDIDGRRLEGHSHGTNSSFGKYEGHPIELTASAVYNQTSGQLYIHSHGLGDADEGAVRFTITAQVESAPMGSPINIANVVLEGTAYGQKMIWRGTGLAIQATP